MDETSQARVLWNLQYEQHSPHSRGQPQPQNQKIYKQERILKLPSPSMDLVFDDGILDSVKWAWQKIMGEEADSEQFLVFPEREGLEDDEDF
jgi:Rab proteins geranylgeranyltransferase component A